ncbi:MAG TPA: hypothetical protein VN802_24065 [Stellaceae bacterium]|nr:hypothetical protein [Stellaceae bacterium]
MLACLSPNGMNRFDGKSAPSRLLVATSKGVSVLERSAPGAEWRPAGTTLTETHATTLTTVPGQAGVFAGTHGDGVFYSADGGAHWEQRNNGLAIKDVYSIAANARDGGITLYAGTQPASLFRSRDLGKSWEEMPSIRQVPGTEFWTFPAPPRIAHTKMIVVDPRNPDWIYAAIEQGALLKTRDGGRTWRELDSYSRPDDRAYRDIHQVMLVPSRPETVFMTTGVGLYRSDDGGEKWERLTGEEFRIAYPDHMMLSPDERTLFMSGAKFHPGFWMSTHVADTAIARSRDLGKTWDTVPRGFDVPPRANIEALTMAVHPGGYALFVGDTEGLVHSSEDGGDSWVRIADAVGPVTKGNHADALRGERRPRAEARA